MKRVSLDIRSGEILGVAGVAGNGLAELEDALTGMTPAGQLQGEVSLDGRDILGAFSARLRRLGLRRTGSSWAATCSASGARTPRSAAREPRPPARASAGVPAAKEGSPER